MIEARGVNGTVTFDGQTVTIHRSGFMARATVGKGTKTIPIGSITAVQWKPAGAVRGFIQFTVPGGNERRSQFGRQSTDAARDENSVLFGRKHQPAFEQVRDHVQATIRGGSNLAGAPAASVADELAKLAGLRDQGVLSNAEFEQQKARLLG